LQAGCGSAFPEHGDCIRVSRYRPVKARQDLIREGEAPDVVHLILDGFACRYKVLPDGTRSIMA
jgi:CRP-like cAMP-binding protein